jgi:hypothetical protein
MKPKLTRSLGVLLLILSIRQFSFADFSLVCPPNLTISCREDYLHDLNNKYGMGYTDFNGVIKILHDCKTTIEVDDCGKGEIRRVWGVENPENWKWLTCTQVITISNIDGFKYEDITWPLSIVIRSCDPQSDFKKLLPPYDAPSWERPKCSKPMVSYKDSHFKVDDGCEKIIREWKVLDWCQYDPFLYPGRGIFSYTQVIKLISTSDSLNLVCKKDTIVFNNRTCDTIYVNLDSAVFNSSCKIFNRIYNTSKYSISGGANASGYYPEGITKFFYIAEYACGTEIKCEVTVDVRNKLQPTPYCLTGVVLTLMPSDTDQNGSIDDGMIEVWASDLDKGSWHKCPGQKLRFSFSNDVNDRSRIYRCKDVGTNEVAIWVTDTLGNQDLCKTIIEIQNNDPNIPDCNGSFQGHTSSIAGKVLFYNTPVPPGMTVQLNSQSSQIELNLNKNNNFQYEFSDVEMNNSYSIKSSCLNYTPSLIDFEDLSYLRSLINGKIIAKSPFTILAADLNQDHKLNYDDYLIMRQLIYFKKYQLLPVKWKFIPESFKFSDPTNPLADIMPEGIELQVLNHEMKDQNFIAVRIGDLVSVTANAEIEARENIDSRQVNLKSCTVEKNGNGNSIVNFILDLPLSQMIQLNIYSIDGKSLIHKNIFAEQGEQKIQLELKATGIQIYSINNDEINLTGKFFISE